jgi:hypothetical protein
MDGHITHNRGGRIGIVSLVAGVLVLLVACGSFIPRQGWNPSYGPVVPHDSFPADCSLCHVSGDWHTIRKDFAFDHQAQTGVPLNGAHQAASCIRCHNDRGPVGTFSAKGCSGCHEDIHRGKLGRMCDDCHNETTWQPEEAVSRHARTRFPLVGPHAAAACWRCHPGAQVGNFEGLDPTCLACHTEDLARAVAPNHAQQGWTNDCQRCHTQLNWKPARFNHPSSFPLAAGHAGRDCTECHQGGAYTGLSRDCATCHMDDYQRTTGPNHAASGFSTNCTGCHNTATWLGATFNHPPSFPLTGGHAGRGCATCHQGGVYTGVSTACASCHLDDYQRTTTPNHAASGFSTNCTSCHNTTTWLGAAFSHPASFPLTGGHGGRACSACHQSGVFTGLSTTCVSCHQSKYQQTTNPNHAAAGFPTTCNTCHSTTTWTGATFNHSFPITSGPHRLACSECHTSPSNFQVFVCTNCHTHNQASMATKHQGVSGYAWSSTACLSCHPNGRH